MGRRGIVVWTIVLMLAVLVAPANAQMVEIPEFVPPVHRTPEISEMTAGEDFVIESTSRSRWINPDLVIELEPSTPVIDGYVFRLLNGVAEPQTSPTVPITIVHLVDHEYSAVLSANGRRGPIRVGMSLENLDALLYPPTCPEVKNTGVRVTVTSGEYLIRGNCNGDIDVTPASGFQILDPDRLDRDDGWSVRRVSSSSRFNITIAETTTFTLQRWQNAPEPSGTGSWVDVTSSMTGLSATTQLRPKP